MVGGEGVGGGGVLDPLAVDGDVPWVGCILLAGWREVLESPKQFFDIPRHGYINGFAVVMPRDVEAAVEQVGPIGRDGVELLKGAE